MNKIYLGKGKPDKFNQIRLNICLSDVNDDMIFKSQFNGKEYLSCYLAPLRQQDDKGNTYSIYTLERNLNDNSKPAATNYGKEQKIARNSSGTQNRGIPEHTQQKVNAYQPQQEGIYEDENDIAF